LSQPTLIVAVLQLITAVDLMQWLQLLQKGWFCLFLFHIEKMQWRHAASPNCVLYASHCKKGNRRYRGTFLCSASLTAMPKNNNTKALLRARQMPRLFHTLPGEEYSDAKSEVLRWLWDQPELRDALRQFCTHNGAIVYDKADGTWRGADTP
jgi:hypothetical protein